MRFATALILSTSLVLLAACEKAAPPPSPPPPAPAPPPPPPPAPLVELTEGFLDYAHWAKWIQSPPRVLLVTPMDATSQKLIAAQTRIFSALVNPPPDTAAIPVGDIQAQLDAIKNSFPAKRQVHPIELRHPLDHPHHDRWDAYRRTVAHTTLTNLPSIITQLERKLATDLRDLEPQLRSEGVAGAQARTDTKWLRETMTRQIENLKAIGKTAYVSPASPAVKAREEWALFESTDLPVIQKIIEACTITEGNLAENGSFRLQGRGQLVATATVAGRQLYFTPQSPGELRFLNIKTSKTNAP